METVETCLGSNLNVIDSHSYRLYLRIDCRASIEAQWIQMSFGGKRGNVPFPLPFDVSSMLSPMFQRLPSFQVLAQRLGGQRSGPVVHGSRRPSNPIKEAINSFFIEKQNPFEKKRIVTRRREQNLTETQWR